MISLTYYLLISAILFAIGVYGLISKRSFIRLLISVEIIFNAANLNLVAFNTYNISSGLGGHIFAMFAIAVAAAEAAVGLALSVTIFRSNGTIDVTKLRKLRG